LPPTEADYTAAGDNHTIRRNLISPSEDTGSWSPTFPR
jgi:hypothetical protein